jgi:hypothetical protein
VRANAASVANSDIMMFNGGFDDDTNTLLASPTCEADLGMSGIGRDGEFSIGGRSELPVCGRHRGPRCLQCSRANGSVRLTFAGKGGNVSLPQAPSADGGRYADGGMEFWIKGKTARLTRAGAVTECKTR